MATTAQATAQDPTAQDPTAQDPAAQDPATQDPADQRDADYLFESEFIRVTFQHGLPPKVGVNGAQIEDVLDVARQRLERYQATDLACEENADALAAIAAARDAMARRRARRKDQGVFQTYEPHSGERTEDLDQDFSATGA